MRCAACCCTPTGACSRFATKHALRIDIHDPRTAALLGSFVIGPIEVDELGGDFSERSSPEQGYYFHVAILASRPLLDSLLPMNIANAPHREPPAWEPTLLDELAGADIYPNRFTRMALHPNQRWLAVLDRGR